MIEEVFKEGSETVIIDRNFENFLPLRNLAPRGGREEKP
jgi:hypothetical protein